MVHDDYLAEALTQITAGGAADPPATRYWGLRYNSTGVPANGVELTAAGYARESMTTSSFWSASTFTNGAPCRVNAAALSFGTPSGVDWGYVNELCLYDGATDTEPMLIFNISDGTGSAVMFLRDGVEVRFEAGEIVLYAVNSNY